MVTAAVWSCRLAQEFQSVVWRLVDRVTPGNCIRYHDVRVIVISLIKSAIRSIRGHVRVSSPAGSGGAISLGRLRSTPGGWLGCWLTLM